LSPVTAKTARGANVIDQADALLFCITLQHWYTFLSKEFGDWDFYVPHLHQLLNGLYLFLTFLPFPEQATKWL
jgi:hypothetical protein